MLPGTLPLPRPQTNQLRNDVSLVVETAPRRCNHLTRAPIARQASTNPAFNSARVSRERETSGLSRRENFKAKISESLRESRYQYVYLNAHERDSKNKRCESSKFHNLARLGQDWCKLIVFHSTTERLNLLKLSVVCCGGSCIYWRTILFFSGRFYDVIIFGCVIIVPSKEYISNRTIHLNVSEIYKIRATQSRIAANSRHR